MKKFDFFFGLNLSQRIFSHIDNLSETLQKVGMSATSGQHNVNLTKDAFKKIRNDDCFATFYQTVLRKKKQLHVSITEPALPRNKRAPGRFEVGTATPLFPVTPEQVYRRIYFEALDLIVSSTEERFDQTSFKAYSNMESLLKGVF